MDTFLTMVAAGCVLGRWLALSPPSMLVECEKAQANSCQAKRGSAQAGSGEEEQVRIEEARDESTNEKKIGSNG